MSVSAAKSCAPSATMCRRSSLLRRAACALLIVSTSSVAAFAQGVTGTVSGTVKDAQGQPVAACVYAEALFAELDRDAVGCEPEAGGIVRLEEQPGQWRLTTQAEGYEPASIEVNIPAGDTIETDIIVRPA